MKKICLIDMDGTLVNFNERFMEIWNQLVVGWGSEELGIKPAPSRKLTELPRKFHLHEAWDGLVSEENADKIMRAPGFFRSLTPLPGAREALQMMLKSDIIDPYICTAPVVKSSNCWQEKIECIRQHFGEEFVKRTLITRDKTLVHGTWLIDDKPHITGVNDRNPSWMHVIYDQPHNRDPLEWKRTSAAIQTALDVSGSGKKYCPPRITWENWINILDVVSEYDYYK